MTQPLSVHGSIWAATMFACPAAGAVIGFTLGFLNFIIMLQDFEPTILAFWAMLTLAGAVVGLVLGLPVILLVGLPAHAFLYRRGWVSLAPYLVVGAAAGILPVLAVNSPAASEYSLFISNVTLFLVWLGGPLAAWFAWLIRRPDRDLTLAHLTQPPAA